MRQEGEEVVPSSIRCNGPNNISTGQLGWLPDCAPSQLLHTCSLAEYRRLEKVLGFIATTENISVINILLVLNAKHSSYWEEN